MASNEELFKRDVQSVLNQLSVMLCAKNRKYGDSALSPKQVFSNSSPIELLNVRIDDKLSRIANKQGDEDEDVEWDLLGYLVLKRIALERKKDTFPNAPYSIEDYVEVICGDFKGRRGIVVAIRSGQTDVVFPEIDGIVVIDSSSIRRLE